MSRLSRHSDDCNVTPKFVLGGESIFTLSNGRGKHMTFKVYRRDPRPDDPKDHWVGGVTYFIKVLTGPDNTSEFTYIGMLTLPPPGKVNDPAIRITSHSKFSEDSNTVRSARFVLRAIWQIDRGTYRLPPGYTIKHMDRCGRCGHPLTTPESLDTGFGPDCAAQLGIEWGERDRAQGVLIGDIDPPPNSKPAKRTCDRCGKSLPIGHPIEVCARCAEYDLNYSKDSDLALETGHPGHPSNFGDN